MTDYVQCKICGSDRALSGTKLCDGCWEVESRLTGFLRHPNAVKLVCEELADADPRFACLKNLALDEPVFILKAKDKLSVGVVTMWAGAAELQGTPKEKVRHARTVAEDMLIWGLKHGTKVPD